MSGRAPSGGKTCVSNAAIEHSSNCLKPVVRRAAAVANRPNGGAGGAVPATLSPTPRTLHLLWDEYEQGIGGRKAARFFSREERGKAKHKYHRRKVVWDCIAELVRAGLTSQVAIDRIYQVYGENPTVTRIINRMKEDRQNGIVHPSLQVYLTSIRLLYTTTVLILYASLSS
jgi:hypothetical protein